MVIIIVRALLINNFLLWFTISMDQRKELIIKVLERLQWHRDMADWILSLMKISDLDDNTIEWLIQIIWDAVKNTKKVQEKEKLEKSLNQIQKIKTMELSEKCSDEELDGILSNI